MSLCDHCLEGVTHVGEPKGSFEVLNGVRVYLSKPPRDSLYKEKAVLFIPDAFGVELINSQLLVDDFARCGFLTCMPDHYLGDGVPIETYEDAELRSRFDTKSWIKRHSPDRTRPILSAVIAGLRSQGIKEIAATGYCFGAKAVFDLAFEGQISVAAVSHPTLLAVPEDLEHIRSTGIPLLVNSCEFDPQYPPASQKVGDEILGGGSMDGYKRTYFAGCSHGFAIRGDISQPAVRRGKEGSFKATVAWFVKHFRATESTSSEDKGHKCRL